MSEEMTVINDSKEIATMIKKMRKQRKITQTKLAAYTGLSRAGIAKIEFGASDIKLSTLISIANLLGLNLFYNEELVGVLIEDDEERLSFSYAKSWLDKKSSFNISINLPLREDSFGHMQTKAFFENLLPEGEVKLAIESLSEKNVTDEFHFLKEYGVDCAGAFIFKSHG